MFFLMLHQWTKGGTLPDDRLKLAGLARCTPEELDELIKRWPKLEPVEGQPGRTGIPYLVSQWEQVMVFYEKQSQRGKASVDARARRKARVDEPGCNQGSTTGSTNQEEDQEEDQNKDSSSYVEDVVPTEEHASRIPEVEVPLEEVKKAARLINACLRKLGESPVTQLELSQAELIASCLQDPGWVKELRMALKYVEGNPWFKENPGKFTLDLILRPGKVSAYAAKFTGRPAPSSDGSNGSRPPGGGAALAPLTEVEVRSMLGDHYDTYSQLLEIFPCGKIVPTRDIPTILHILKETSATSLIQAAKIHRAQCMDGENGSTRFMKSFDKWAELGLHLLANDSRAERTPRPALRQNITGGHDLAAMAMKRATQDLATNLGVEGIPEAPDV